MRTLNLIALCSFALALSAPMAANASPAKMLHITTETIGTLDAHKSDSMMDYYLVGEEAARLGRPLNKQGQVVHYKILNPPQLWSVDLKAKTADCVLEDRKHPVGLPIVMEKDLVGLTYGQELKFFQSRKCVRSTRTEAGRTIEEYSLADKDKYIVLDVDQSSKKPLALVVKDAKSKNVFVTMKYVTYDTVPYDAKMFQPPAGLKESKVSMAQLRKEAVEIDAKVASYKNKLIQELAARHTNSTH